MMDPRDPNDDFEDDEDLYDYSVDDDNDDFDLGGPGNDYIPDETEFLS